jgi:radical SAM protein with 4Fe4S-binding SPASM domain
VELLKNINNQMEINDLKFILNIFKGFSRTIDISTNSEALTLDDLPDRVSLIKQYMPHCEVTLTTTFNIDRGAKFISDLFTSGIDKLYISCYGYTAEDYKKIHGVDLFYGLCKNISYLRYVPNINNKSIQLMHMKDTGKYFLIDDCEQKLLDFNEYIKSQRINIHISDCTLSPLRPISSPLKNIKWESPSPCSIVWGERMNILCIRWNLDVVPCCFFSGEEYSLGNLRKSTIDQIFTSDTYKAFHKNHWLGTLKDIPRCNICTYYRNFSSKEECMRLAAHQANFLEGEEVYFWGCGGTYQTYKHLFSKTRPQAVILDLEFASQKKIDNIPIHTPNDIFRMNKKLPIIIFATSKNSARILQKFSSEYPNYKHVPIVVVPATPEIWANVDKSTLYI